MPLSQSHQCLSLSQVTLPDRHGEQTGCTTIRDSGSENTCAQTSTSETAISELQTQWENAHRAVTER